jgi:hypothetical protein
MLPCAHLPQLTPPPQRSGHSVGRPAEHQHRSPQSSGLRQASPRSGGSRRAAPGPRQRAGVSGSAWVAWGKSRPANGVDLQAAECHEAVAAVAGVVGDGDLAPGQDLELLVERVGSDHGVGEVQAVQQRPEPGDLAGGVVDGGLGQDAPVVWSVAASRWTCLWPWWPLPRRVLPATATARRRRAGRRWQIGRWDGGSAASQAPMARSRASGVDAGQHAAHCRLAKRPPDAGQGVTAHPECGQHLAERVAGPLNRSRPGISRRPAPRPPPQPAPPPAHAVGLAGGVGRRSGRGSQAGRGTARGRAQRAHPAQGDRGLHWLRNRRCAPRRFETTRL